MAAPQLNDKLVGFIDDAHAMEQQVLKMLDSMIATTQDQEMLRELAHHKEETERHATRLAERLSAHGKEPSKMKEMGLVGGALLKGLADRARRDKPARNARDGFVTEHLEIASYELLERLATRAGDPETAEVARRNRAEEQAMAEKIAASWDKAVDQTLTEAGATA